MMHQLLLGLVVLVIAGLTSGAAADPMSGDPVRGQKIYDRCIACHSIERDRTGPRHVGLIGRRVGSIAGFAYSPVMHKAGEAGMVWDEATLDRFLESPTKVFPGTRMGYAGIKNAQERADLIAYLKQASADP